MMIDNDAIFARLGGEFRDDGEQLMQLADDAEATVQRLAWMIDGLDTDARAALAEQADDLRGVVGTSLVHVQRIEQALNRLQTLLWAASPKGVK